jgi:hypothetical protein
MSVQDPPSGLPDSPTYWFAVMELARERGFLERAAEAIRHLERLGISVRYDAAKGRRHEPEGALV